MTVWYEIRNKFSNAMEFMSYDGTYSGRHDCEAYMFSGLLPSKPTNYRIVRVVFDDS